MKKLFISLFILISLSIQGQVLTITEVVAGQTYIFNGTATGDIMIASEVSETTVRIRNTTQRYTSDYSTKSGFTDFVIGGVNPTSVEDAVAKINAITTGSGGGASGSLENRIIVRTATDFGMIDSSKEYFLDGIIDMGTTSIEIPAGGIKISGYDFNLSGLTSTASNYTLFTSPIEGSGNVLFDDFYIDISGTNSQVYDISGSTGFEAIEVGRINFNNCTSLGTIDTYRQGLESGTGRFGGTPELTLSGTWIGGYFIDSSIIRGLTNGTYSIYKAGTDFLMSSRFRSNQNIDLNTNIAFFDFSSSNFVNPSTVQLENCIVTRNGSSDASDTTIIPNMSAGDLESSWNRNKGIPNTFEGGSSMVTTEITTNTGTGNQGVFFDLLGTFTTSNLEHFDAPANGQLRNLGDSPREYNVFLDMIIEAGGGNEIDLKLVIWDDSAGIFVDSKKVRRVVNNLQGGRDIAYFNYLTQLVLDQNDFVKIQVSNITANTNITAELDSSFTIEAR